MAPNSRPIFVLVHSPLVGPATWASVAGRLEDGGFPVVVPSLVDVMASGPPYYRRLAEAVAGHVSTVECDAAGAAGVPAAPVVLVGHSGAGALLPAVAEAVGVRARAAVFVDALLPHPARSWFDTAPLPLRERLLGMARNGRLPPWNDWFPAEVIRQLIPERDTRRLFVDELPDLPVDYFAEPAPDAPGWETLPRAYVRLSEAYDDAADEARRMNWWVHREDADHLAVLTRPGLLTNILVNVVAALQPSPRTP